MAINFIFSKDSNKTRTKYSKSNNIGIMIDYETDEIIEELFESFLEKYHEGLEEGMKGREFIFDSVDLLYYKCHKISLNRGGPYIDSPEWLKKNNQQRILKIVMTIAFNMQ